MLVKVALVAAGMIGTALGVSEHNTQTPHQTVFKAPANVMPAKPMAQQEGLQDPKQYVSQLYDRYKKDSIILESPSMIYSPTLVKIMRQHRREARTYVSYAPMPEARDPICDCSTYDVTAVKVTITPVDEDEVKALVSFKNFGKPQKTELSLIALNGEWRVDNVRNAHGDLKENLQQVADNSN